MKKIFYDNSFDVLVDTCPYKRKTIKSIFSSENIIAFINGHYCQWSCKYNKGDGIYKNKCYVLCSHADLKQKIKFIKELL